MQVAKLEIDGPIARVCLDHPAGNRVNFAMRAELKAAFEQVAASAARVLVIRGEGADFCLGGDVRDWPGITAAELRPRVGVFAEALDRLERLPIPTIAAVQGGCVGGGLELVLSCDMIIAARSAHFAFPEAKLGILTLQGGMLQIAERVGRAKAAELVFLSTPVTAEQMAQWNVVNRVVDDRELGGEIEALVRRLAVGPTKAYAATKALWRLKSEQGSRSARDALYDLSMPLFDTEDVQTALRDAAEAIESGTPFPTATFKGR